MTEIRDLLAFIEEDSPSGDLTSRTVVPEIRCRAVIKTKAAGVVAGIEEAAVLFSYYGCGVQITKPDRAVVNPGDVLLTIDGDARNILLVERTALNIIGRMGGIATKTWRTVYAAHKVNPKVRIACTRKTAPGLRNLDKKAVIIGGGDPHRSTLSDMILIKDNHLKLVPMREAVRKAKAGSLYTKVEVEVISPEGATEAAELGADIIMLDNMSPERVKATLKALSDAGLRERVIIEISGGIDEKTVPIYASLGADVISMGALTHSFTNLDVSLDILPAVRSMKI